MNNLTADMTTNPTFMREEIIDAEPNQRNSECN